MFADIRVGSKKRNRACERDREQSKERLKVKSIGVNKN